MRRIASFGIFVLMFLSLSAMSVSAQPGGMPAFASITSAVLQPSSVTAGQKATLLVTVTINPGFHINANKPDDPASVPTIFSLMPPKNAGIVAGKAVFPTPKSITVGYSPKPIKGYEDSVVIRVPLTIAKNARAGAIKLSGTVQAQGCNATSCFAPKSFPVNVTLSVTGAKK